MQFITRPIKFICATPFYAIALIATGFIMVSTRAIDWLYPDSKTSVTFMRALMGFNTSQIAMSDEARSTPKPLGLRIYK